MPLIRVNYPSILCLIILLLSADTAWAGGGGIKTMREIKPNGPTKIVGQLEFIEKLDYDPELDEPEDARIDVESLKKIL